MLEQILPQLPAVYNRRQNVMQICPFTAALKRKLN